jgi:hypothetical protein
MRPGATLPANLTIIRKTVVIRQPECLENPTASLIYALAQTSIVNFKNLVAQAFEVVVEVAHPPFGFENRQSVSEAESFTLRAITIG